MNTKPSHLFYQGRERKPMLDQARGVYMWDVDGKRYLDGSSGAMVCNIGHSNENVLEAMRLQMEKSTFGYRLHFETEASEKLAAKTVALCPEGLNRVFFVSGGSEAVESAMKLARQYTLAIGEGSKRLRGQVQRDTIIGDVRGKGLLTAFEFMSDRGTKAPLPKDLRAFDRFVQIAYDKGLIVYARRTRDGTEGDYIIVAPPMIVTETHLDEITEMLAAALTEYADEIQPVLDRVV